MNPQYKEIYIDPTMKKNTYMNTRANDKASLMSDPRSRLSKPTQIMSRKSTKKSLQPDPSFDLHKPKTKSQKKSGKQVKRFSFDEFMDNDLSLAPTIQIPSVANHTPHEKTSLIENKLKISEKLDSEIKPNVEIKPIVKSTPNVMNTFKKQEVKNKLDVSSKSDVRSVMKIAKRMDVPKKQNVSKRMDVPKKQNGMKMNDSMVYNTQQKTHINAKDKLKTLTGVSKSNNRSRSSLLYKKSLSRHSKLKKEAPKKSSTVHSSNPKYTHREKKKSEPKSTRKVYSKSVKHLPKKGPMEHFIQRKYVSQKHTSKRLGDVGLLDRSKPKSGTKKHRSCRKNIKPKVEQDDSDTRSLNGYHHIPVHISSHKNTSIQHISKPKIEIMKKILVSRGFIQENSKAPDSVIEDLFLISLRGNICIEKDNCFVK